MAASRKTESRFVASLKPVLQRNVAAHAQGSRRAILEEGKMEFEENCAACHGKDGTGKGTVTLRERRQILRRYGKACAKPIPGHDTLDMPLFSKRMRAQEGHPGFLPMSLTMG